MDWLTLLPLVGFLGWLWGGDFLGFLTEVDPRTIYAIAALIAAVGVAVALVVFALRV